MNGLHIILPTSTNDTLVLLWAFDKLLSGLSLSSWLMSLLNAEFCITSSLQALMLQEAKQGWHPFIRVKSLLRKSTEIESLLSTHRWVGRGVQSGRLGMALGEEHMAPCISKASPALGTERLRWSGGELSSKLLRHFCVVTMLSTWYLPQYFVRVTWSNG